MGPNRICAVILAGGGGERFWPASSPERPKQFLRLFGERTLLQETVHRLDGLVFPEDTFVVTGRAFASEVRGQFPGLPSQNILTEPVGRDTAAAVALAALTLARRDPRSIMAVLPADHYLAGESEFKRCLKAAARAASDGRWAVTFGIVPTRPETGYGYIERGEEYAAADGLKVYRAARFEEKPAPEKARQFLEGGRHYWNSGMFVWRVDLILSLIQKHLPDHFEALSRAVELGAEEALEEAYAGLPLLSIDYGVMERAENVLVIPATFAWDDVGTWPAWARCRGEADGRGNCVEGPAVLLDTEGCVVRSSGRLVAALGVRDLVIVEENGCVLVCTKDRAQEVKKLAAAAREALAQGLRPGINLK